MLVFFNSQSFIYNKTILTILLVEIDTSYTAKKELFIYKEEWKAIYTNRIGDVDGESMLIIDVDGESIVTIVIAKTISNAKHLTRWLTANWVHKWICMIVARTILIRQRILSSGNGVNSILSNALAWLPNFIVRSKQYFSYDWNYSQMFVCIMCICK